MEVNFEVKIKLNECLASIVHIAAQESAAKLSNKNHGLDLIHTQERGDDYRSTF